jgi:ATP-dependent RNA circularization protein (DNA/RNA ligase family)
MMVYPKIQTLFVRDEKFKVTNEIKLPEFENIKKWLVTEKIDGTNIRIIYTTEGKLLIRGRTDRAEIPKFLFEKLEQIFTVDKFKQIFPELLDVDVILFGEGYGAKIQKGGGNYNKGNSFRLFDIWIGGTWLKWETIEEIAIKIGIKTVPVIAKADLRTAIHMVKSGNFFSAVSLTEGEAGHKAEGIVARSYPLMLFRNKLPIKFKLKVRDFSEGVVH